MALPGHSSAAGPVDLDPGCPPGRPGGLPAQDGRPEPAVLWPKPPLAVDPEDRGPGIEHTTTDRLADIAEASTRALLAVLGWQGTILHSSALPAREGRSTRLADLALLTDSTAYLCGTGGMRYLDHVPFEEHAIEVIPFHTPVDTETALWDGARQVSALWAVAGVGPDLLADAIRSHQMGMHRAGLETALR